MGTGKRNKFKERLANSYKREERRIETKEGLREPLIVLSFRNFDRNQGQDFAMWEREQLLALAVRSEEHTSELQSLMRISYAVFCLNNNIAHNKNHTTPTLIIYKYQYSSLNYR